MSDDLSQKVFLIWDNGMQFPLAMAMRETGGRVLYHTDWDQEYPTIIETCLGDGFDGIERCDDPFLLLDQIDLAIFPNRGHAGEQMVFERFGKRVFGSRLGTELESRRRRFIKLQETLRMDVPDYVIIVGLTKLTKHLEPLYNKFIKIDRFRADCETWKWRSWEESRMELDRLAVKFGPFKEQIPFIVQDEVDTEVETGSDVICVDGQFASHGVLGFEYKDKSYLASLRTWEEMDPVIKEVLDPLVPTLKALNYRNFLSTEQRKTDDCNYLTDITPRLGFPSGNCQIHLYGNLPEVMWHAAAGELIPIEPQHLFAVECLMDHNCSESEWRSLRVPEKALPWINMTNVAEYNGIYHFVPNAIEDTCIGSISGEGDTVQECVDNLLKHVEMLDGQPITVRLDTISNLLKEVHTAQDDHDIEFTEQALPEPATVLNGE